MNQDQYQTNPERSPFPHLLLSVGVFCGVCKSDMQTHTFLDGFYMSRIGSVSSSATTSPCR